MRRLSIFLYVTLLMVNMLSGQESAVRPVITAMYEYAAYHPVEKIYLHLDKPYYAAGEYMYFRAYLTDIHLSTDNAESRIIYVELSDAQRIDGSYFTTHYGSLQPIIRNHIPILLRGLEITRLALRSKQIRYVRNKNYSEKSRYNALILAEYKMEGEVTCNVSKDSA